MYRYFSLEWYAPDAGADPSYAATPLTPTDPECRDVNVILLTDGDEWCDPSNGSTDPVPAIEAAAALHQGFRLADDDPSRPQRSVHTYVINFAGGTQASTDAIATAGGTGESLFATNEAELSAGLADIIAGAIQPESCDNLDNNCNGCTDEGYRVYCNRRSTDCCEWTDEATRTTCLDTFNASITTGNPQGDLTLLPCWDPTASPADAEDPETKWLCRNPGEICDEIDNNCEWDYNEDPDDPSRESVIDEGMLKCPLCPTTEFCDFEDNDCDGEIDELPATDCATCNPSAEICDTIDNDCDGFADNGGMDGGGAPLPLTLPCALTSAPNCQGTRTCTAGNYGGCVVSTTAEICDDLDNDCNGRIDDGAPGEVCDPTIPLGRSIVYQSVTYPDTICAQGEIACGSTSCVGAVGPSTEVCDGFDNDCDGVVDVAWDSADLPMVGEPCGACDIGLIACVDGALTCEITGTAPAEVCDGVDNDCDGLTDETPLADAPATAGCWATPAAGCTAGQTGSFGGLQWCAPDGATPTGIGTLMAPCSVGNLQCVSGAWACLQSRIPSTEICDGVNNDCDNATDEGASGPLTVACSLTSADNCQGTRTCASGSFGACSVNTSEETCDDLDNDCDGMVNEGVAATPCEPALPVERTELVYNDGTNNTNTTCRRGAMPCNGTSCVGAVGPTTEVCDGVDNDCDGRVDVAWNDAALPSVGSNCGACDLGSIVCNGGSLECQVSGTVPAEVCDNVDNDCDGLVDEAPLADAPNPAGCWSLPSDDCDPTDVCSFGVLQWCAPEGANCTDTGTLTEPCSAGVLQCVGGDWACRQETAPEVESCDGVDNDCDGTPDQGADGSALSVSCVLPNAGHCQGTSACVNGSYGTCNVTNSSSETCDGIDNDCNGLVDDGIPGTVCEPALPEGRTALVYNDGTNHLTTTCQRGERACGSATCVGAVGPTSEICDGLDNDCDGQVDIAWNGSSLPLTGGACGACGGTVTCASGALTCVTSGTPPVETCDGVDNDCDGQVDESPLADAPAEAGCWTLAPEACDAEDVCRFGDLSWCPPEGATCTDLGELQEPCSAGSLQCKNGGWLCLQDSPPSAEVCDGVDNDCDGTPDQGADGSPLSVSCVLASASHCQGTSSCVNGVFGTCSANSSNPETCDGTDNDCNGLVDDGIPGTVCEPALPTGRSALVYNDAENPSTTCRRGERACGSATCAGAVGPTSEICDGLDNDCDGQVDVALNGDPLPMTGGPCGACGAGTVTCVSGALVCVAGDTLPVEICDGYDNDCDGQIDEGPLADAPAEPGCWTLAADDCDATEVCQFGSLAWCPPEGATCVDAGTLTEPCGAGSLQCIDGAWLCQQDSLPSAEVCDGADNDCDGSIDDALDSPVGDPCGDDIGACSTGITACDNGALTCTGTGPQVETCNGVDDDCDGEIDNGIPVGGECTPGYEAASFPGSRSSGTCQEGRLECDPEGSGQLLCMGGIGPEPEVCDAIDNDCDGRIDEPGDAPDGVDGSADPEDPTRILGENCGASDGICEPGILACINGSVACEGGVGAQIEECDCEDNDCDGTVDDSDPAICSPGKSCVQASGRCFCAAPCTSGEFDCASGSYACETVPVSGTEDTGRYCIPPDPCARCALATVRDSQDTIECAPTGSDADGATVPACVCKDQTCHSPCFGITCDGGLRCVPTGTAAGTCHEESCYFFGCDAGSVCKDGSCVADPCSDNPCEAEEVCKPTTDGSDARCAPSCADVACAETERCVDGECEPTGCDEVCGELELCLADGQCGVSLCEVSTSAAPLACSDGSYCEPSTGSCVDDPCTGVHCPSGQVCASGECLTATTDTGGGTGTGGGSNSDDDGGEAGAAGATTTPNPEERGAWGLATGGGGCSCRIQQGSGRTLGLSGLVLAALLLRRRRRLPETTEKGGLR
jgi:hypothetical protein